MKTEISYPDLRSHNFFIAECSHLVDGANCIPLEISYKAVSIDDPIPICSGKVIILSENLEQFYFFADQKKTIISRHIIRDLISVFLKDHKAKIRTLIDKGKLNCVILPARG